MRQADPVEPVARGPAGLDHRHVPSADEDRLKAAFPVFDRAKRASDRLSDHLASVIERSVERFPDLDLDPEKSRLVTPPNAFTTYFLVAGRTTLALFDERGSGTIGAVAHADSDRGAGTSFRGTGRVEVKGLLPDDACDARVVLRDGSSMPAPAPYGCYSVLIMFRRAAELPATLEFTRGGRRIVVPVVGADDEVLTLHGPRGGPGPAT
jgi:hypothetical protein